MPAEENPNICVYFTVMKFFPEAYHHPGASEIDPLVNLNEIVYLVQQIW